MATRGYKKEKNTGFKLTKIQPKRQKIKRLRGGEMTVITNGL